MRRSLWLVIACAAPLALAGCEWRAGAGATVPVGYVEVTSAPVQIETYPHTVYDGRPVYLYQDRWYYREGGHWRYYRNDPPGLQQQRERMRREHAQPPPRRDQHQQNRGHQPDDRGHQPDNRGHGH